MVERLLVVVVALLTVASLVALHRWVVRRLWAPVFEAEVAEEDDGTPGDE